MTIEEKVLASCKTSYAKYGLKKDELSKLVDQIIASRGLTDESTDEDVTKSITAIEPYVGMMQSSFNRAISEMENKYKGWKKPEDIVPPVPPVPSTGNLTPEMVEKMISERLQKATEEAVNAAIAPYKEKEERTRLNSLFNANEKIKDVPQQFRSRFQLDKEENLETMAQQCADEWTALKQSMVSSGQFVEAPHPATPEMETNDFVKKMENYATHRTPSK